MDSNNSIEKSIRIAAASNEIEGFTVDEEMLSLVTKVLNNEITHEEYIDLLKIKAGVSE